MARVARLAQRIPIVLMAIFIILPMVAVLLYSFATRWTSNILPDGYTFEHWIDGFTDARFAAVLVRTLLLAIACAVLDLILVTPAVYWQKVRNPRIRPFLELAAAIPFAIPFVVIAFGLLALSGRFAPQLQGTLWLLLPAHAAVAFSFVYWAVDSSMTSAGVARLSEAARTCGAGPMTILWRVVLPNIGPGIASGALLAFGASFNEIALVQMLVGNRFETVPLYMLNLLKGSNADFNLLAVMTSVTFLVTLVLSIAVVYVNGGATTQLANTNPGRRETQ
ncbi:MULTISPECIES: ABC transporter permease [unclassified Devosia]|uniref:ABC transporter permease n=1 Tax=unclassified Devosia TaxID=196773 RepID=UPI001AC654FA|nr:MULTISPECIES: ABC transporter permease subunit [unclassified Devosia]MBN9303825.1 ABC transporter permease subunit [Devosia sp.]